MLRALRIIGGVAVWALIVGAVCLVVLGFLVAEALRTKDGDDLARDAVHAHADALDEELGPYYVGALDAETLAATFFNHPPELTPIAWNGATTEQGGAVVEVRITREVPASVTGFFVPSNTAGSWTDCWRFTVREFGDAHHERMDCPSDMTAPTPVASEPPRLPDGTDTLLETVLANATASSLATDVRAAFPSDDLTVDTRVTSAGELVAAVGVQGTRSCVARVRAVDGEVFSPSYRSIQLEPGETGCTSWLHAEQ